MWKYIGKIKDKIYSETFHVTIGQEESIKASLN